MSGFNLKKTWARSKDCAAMRCNEAPAGTVMGACWDLDESERVPLCLRHVGLANTAFRLWEVEGAVVLDNGALDGRPVVPAVEPTAPPAILAELSQETEEAESALTLAREFAIVSQDDLAFAAEVLAQAKGQKKKLEERLAEITRPLNDALKSTRALFRAPLDYYDAIERELKARIAEAKLREAEANRDAMRAAADAHAAGDVAGTASALATVKHVANVDGLTTRTQWDFEIVNADLLPRLFLMPNEKLIKEHAAHWKGTSEPTPIPGVRFFPKVVVASRSAT